MSEFNNLGQSEVISVASSEQLVVSHTTFKTQEFMQALKDNYFGRANPDVASKWLIEGADCKVLSPGKGWRKGKVKIGLVFCPDEIDSPLDDIRQAIAENV